MHGENLCLFNRKNLNAILFPNFQTPHGTTVEPLYNEVLGPMKITLLYII